MQIRASKPKDIARLMEIYQQARQFMCLHGNANQWINGYPSKTFIREEIESGHSYVCTNDEGNIIGTFCFIIGEDPTYQTIYEGEWLNNEPYGVIHRLAAANKAQGVSDACLKWCAQQINNLRADTHQDNTIMQHILTKHGFLRCGIIHVKNGTERIAYQRIQEFKNDNEVLLPTE